MSARTWICPQPLASTRPESAWIAEDADVVVVGMGPGGEALPDELAEAGLLVVGIDARLVGGSAPITGACRAR